MDSQQMDPRVLTLGLILIAFMMIVWWEVLKFVIGKIKNDIADIKYNAKRTKQFNEQKKTMEEMKSKGEMHEWTNMPISGVGESVTVCKKTGWVPSVEGFVSVEIIRKYEESKKVEDRLLVEYEAFKKERVADIVERYELDIKPGSMEKLMNDVYSIRKDFHVQKMEKTLKEYKDGSTTKTE